MSFGLLLAWRCNFSHMAGEIHCARAPEVVAHILVFVFLWDGKLPGTWKQIAAAPSPQGQSVWLSPVATLLCLNGELKEHPSCCLEDARWASCLPTKLLWPWAGNKCVCLGGMLSVLWVFSPHPHLASQCFCLMESSRGPLNQCRFLSARKLLYQGSAVVSQPSKGPCTCLFYLSHLTSSYQKEHNVTVPCTPVGNTRVKSRLLETVPQKGDWKELAHSLPDAFISDSLYENARYHRKESLLFSMCCLLVSYYVNGVRSAGPVTEGVHTLCSTVSAPPLAQEGKYSSSLILLFMW